MIKTFVCSETEKLFNHRRSARFKQVEGVALRKLYILHAATSLIDLKTPPGNHLKKLDKERLGQYSIRINDQWRLCFTWKECHAYGVEIVDYH